MSYGPAKSVEAHDTDAGGHMAMWLWGVFGALAITAGLWLSFAPASGEISFIFSTFDVTGIPELLGPGLLLVGGAVVAVSLFAGAWRDYQFDENRILVWVQAFVGAIGLLAAILGLLSIIDRLDLYTVPGLPF